MPPRRRARAASSSTRPTCTTSSRPSRSTASCCRTSSSTRLDPRLMLADVHRLLKPGGEVWISLPNSRSWLRGLFGRSWINWHVPFHITHFSADRLRSLLAEAGFRRRRRAPDHAGAVGGAVGDRAALSGPDREAAQHQGGRGADAAGARRCSFRCCGPATCSVPATASSSRRAAHEDPGPRLSRPVVPAASVAPARAPRPRGAACLLRGLPGAARRADEAARRSARLRHPRHLARPAVREVQFLQAPVPGGRVRAPAGARRSASSSRT